MSGYVTLYAGELNHVSAINRILNKELLNNKYVWIQLPEKMYPHVLVSIKNSSSGEVIDCFGLLREGKMLRVPSNMLCIDIGLHQYELTFINTINADNYHYYFQYIIQDDNPEKPYIYMNRKENDNVTVDIFE